MEKGLLSQHLATKILKLKQRRIFGMQHTTFLNLYGPSIIPILKQWDGES